MVEVSAGYVGWLVVAQLKQVEIRLIPASVEVETEIEAGRIAQYQLVSNFLSQLYVFFIYICVSCLSLSELDRHHAGSRLFNNITARSTLT